MHAHLGFPQARRFWRKRSPTLRAHRLAEAVEARRGSPVRPLPRCGALAACNGGLCRFSFFRRPGRLVHLGLPRAAAAGATAVGVLFEQPRAVPVGHARALPPPPWRERACVARQFMARDRLRRAISRWVVVGPEACSTQGEGRSLWSQGPIAWSSPLAAPYGLWLVAAWELAAPHDYTLRMARCCCCCCCCDMMRGARWDDLYSTRACSLDCMLEGFHEMTARCADMQHDPSDRDGSNVPACPPILCMTRLWPGDACKRLGLGAV